MDSVRIVIGNICSVLAMGTDSFSSTQKTATRVLWVQTLSQLIYFIGTMVLKGYSGAVQNAISLVRNLVAIKKIESKILEWTFVALGVVLGLIFNNLGWMGLLPIVANFLYTLAVFRFKDNEVALKIAFLISVLLFAFFNLAIFNFVGFCTNLFVALTTIIFLLKKKKSA